MRTSSLPIPKNAKQTSSPWERPLLLILLLGAFALRIQGLTRFGLWRDEVDAIYFAVRPLAETVSMFTSPAQNGPLYFLCLRPWFSWAGSSEFALRFPSAGAGVLAVALTWSVARLLMPWSGRRTTQVAALSTPWLAALFLAVNPYQLWYGQEGKMYALIVAISLLSARLWLTGMAWRGPGGWRPWLGYVVVTSLGFYTHLLMILHIPLHLAWYGVATLRRGERPPGHRGYLWALAGLTLPYLPMLVWQWDLVVRAEATTGFRFVPLDQLLRTLIFVQTRGFLPVHWGWIVLPLLLAMAGVTLGRRAFGGENGGIVPDSTPWPELGLGPGRTMLLLGSWLVLPPLTIHALSTIKPVFVDRYVIWIAPALCMIMALGVATLGRRGWPRRVGLGIGLTTAAIWLGLGWQQSHTPLKADLRGAVAYVESHRQPDDLLILQVPHMAFSYRYYTSDFGPYPFEGSEARLAPWAEGLWTNNGFGLPVAQLEVERTMQSMTAGVDEIWLVRSEAELWDERGLMEAWLDSHFTLDKTAEFTRAEVRAYRR